MTEKKLAGKRTSMLLVFMAVTTFLFQSCGEELKLDESTDNASALEPANWTGKSVKTNVEISEQNCDGVKTTTTTTKVETTFTFADGSTETRTSVTTETK